MDDERVLKTYRYLRLSLVVLTVVLITSVVVEIIDTGAVLESVSSYYYSPARSVFVASLVGIGVGLVALQGQSVLEDALLNLAGMLAPLVAFVPTTYGVPTPVTRPGTELELGVQNNLVALLAGALAAFVLLAALGVSRGRRSGDRIGVLAGASLVGATAGWYHLSHDSFLAYAHAVAAVAMFALFFLVVLIDSRSATTRGYRRAYAAIVVAMVAVQLVWLSFPFWGYAVLVVEAVLIVLFAAFWLIQTWELR